MESLANGSQECSVMSPVACYILPSTSCSSGSISSPVTDVLKEEETLNREEILKQHIYVSVPEWHLLFAFILCQATVYAHILFHVSAFFVA